MVFHHFHHWNLYQEHSSHHKTNQHVWIDDFSHKNHQNWSIETEIRALFLFNATRVVFLVALIRKMTLISVSVDQFWWFLWLKSSIHTCWFVLWWPEPLAWPFRWVKLAWKRISSWLLYAPYTTVGHRPRDPLNVNQIGFFWHFRQKLVKLNQKMLVEQWKVKKLQSESPYSIFQDHQTTSKVMAKS